MFNVKIFEFLRFFLKSFSLNEYNFKLKDRYIGALQRVFGYPKTLDEIKIIQHIDFDEFVINQEKIFVERDLFKPGELGYLYKEVFTEKNNPHGYEHGAVNILPGDVVVDAGACEGFFALKALKRGASKVYLFEPLEALQRNLAKTFSEEISKGKIVLVPYALSDQNGLMPFNDKTAYICEAHFDNAAVSHVKTISMDEFVELNNLSRIDFLKMDIEDAEVKAIAGSIKTIKRFKPKISLAVYHGHENANLIKGIIQKAEKLYRVDFGGCYMFEEPYRPYMLYALHGGARVHF